MKKFLILGVALGFLSVAVQAMAIEETKKSIEFGFFSGEVLSSASPISDIGVSADIGRGVKFIGPIVEHIDFTLGYAERSYDLSMGSVALGKIDSTVFSSTVRFRFNLGKYVRPHVGWGVHYTSFGEAVLADGSVKLNAASGVGPLAEFGVAFPFGGGFYVDANLSQHIWVAKGVRLETSVGHALLTEVNINPYWMGISIGKSF